MNIKAFAVAF